MKNTMQMTTHQRFLDRNRTATIGGLAVRTDLRAGLTWDDLDDKAQELWNNLTSSLSNLPSSSDTSTA